MLGGQEYPPRGNMGLGSGFGGGSILGCLIYFEVSERACQTRRAAVRSSMARPTDLNRIRCPLGAVAGLARFSPISAWTFAPERRTSPDSRSTASRDSATT